MAVVPCAIANDGWLCIPHADGKWVTAAKLQPFSLAIIECWRREATGDLTVLTVRTRHPQDYVLINEADGTRWRADADGMWKRAE